MGRGIWAVLAAGAWLAVACGGSSSSGSGDGTPEFGIDDLSDDVDVTEVELDLNDDFDIVTGIADLDGTVFAVTADGLVVQSEDGDDWTQLDDVDGFDNSVYSLTTVDGALLALTFDELLRSEDGQSWEPVDATGIDIESVRTLTRDGEDVIAIGGDSEKYTLYESDDGETWESADTDGLADPEEYKAQAVVSLAARGSEYVVSVGAEHRGSFDDIIFGIWTSADRGITWENVGTSNDVNGLEELDQPNTDVIPLLLAVDDGFVALGGDEDGEATLWRSEDGKEWDDPMGLGGPDLSFPGQIDAAGTTEDSVLAMTLVEDELTIWSVDAD